MLANAWALERLEFESCVCDPLIIEKVGCYTNENVDLIFKEQGKHTRLLARPPPAAVGKWSTVYSRCHAKSIKRGK